MKKELATRVHPHWTIQLPITLLVMILFLTGIFFLTDNRYSIGGVGQNIVAICCGLTSVIGLCFVAPASFMTLGQPKKYWYSKKPRFMGMVSVDRSAEKVLSALTGGKATNVTITKRNVVHTGEMWLVQNRPLSECRLGNFFTWLSIWLSGRIFLHIEGTYFPAVRIDTRKPISCVEVTFVMDNQTYSLPLTVKGGYPVFFRQEKPRTAPTVGAHAPTAAQAEQHQQAAAT